LSSLTPTEFAEQHSSFIEHMKQQQLMSVENGIHANGNTSSNDVMNVIKNDEKEKEKEKEIQPTTFFARTPNTTADEITPVILTHIPTVVVIDVDKTEDENEKIVFPIIDDTSITTISTKNILPVIIINETSDQHVSIEQIDSQQQTLSDYIQVNIFYILY
jgi:hypothetical protein